MSFLRRALAGAEARLPKGLMRFLMVGVGGLMVDLLVLSLLSGLGVHKAAARVGSIAAATLFTWVLNRWFTFGDSGRGARRELGRYALVAAAAQSVNYVVFIGVSDLVHAMPLQLAAFIGSVVAAAFSYTGQRYFTFGADPSLGRAASKAEAEA